MSHENVVSPPATLITLLLRGSWLRLGKRSRRCRSRRRSRKAYRGVYWCLLVWIHVCRCEVCDPWLKIADVRKKKRPGDPRENPHGRSKSIYVYWLQSCTVVTFVCDLYFGRWLVLSISPPHPFLDYFRAYICLKKHKVDAIVMPMQIGTNPATIVGQYKFSRQFIVLYRA